MTKNKNSKPTLLLVSIYDWDHLEFNEENEKNVPKEFVYEFYVRNIEDMVVLSHRFSSKVKYKKPTDKNWYTYRSMVYRLFRKEIDGRNIDNQLKLIAVNELGIDEEQPPLYEPILDDMPNFNKLTLHGFGIELDRA